MVAGIIPAAPASRTRKIFVIFGLFLLILAVIGMLWPDMFSGALGPRFDAERKNLIGRDFLNIWVGPQLAASGEMATLFDPQAYWEAIRTLLDNPDIAQHTWSYPPTALFYAIPFAQMPYLWAYGLWLASTLILWLWACREYRWFGLWWGLLALSPTALITMYTGQNGFLTAALFIAGLQWTDRRPLLAGLCFGLLTFKPQLGLLIPLYLILGGHWKTFWSAVVAALLFNLASLLAFGWESWVDYVELVMPFQVVVLEHGEGLMEYMMPTFFMLVRSVGFSAESGYLAQGLAAILIVSIACYVFWRAPSGPVKQAVLISATMLVSPYVFNYDMVVFTVAVMTLLDAGARDRYRPGEQFLLWFAWGWPVLMVIFGLLAGMSPLSPLPVLAVFTFAVWRALRYEREQQNEIAAHSAG